MRQWRQGSLCGNLKNNRSAIWDGGITMNEIKYWLWLSMVFGTGSRRIWEAMNLFENPREAYNALKSGKVDVTLSEHETKNIKNTMLEQVQAFMEQCEKSDVHLAAYSSKEYPPQLRHIFNPPAVLYYRGNIGCLRRTKTVTSVGTRRACDYSLRAASQICGELAKSGFVIVSGFAVGIDITTHLAAADQNRPTACVLGCGVDIDYPRDNFRYRDKILASGGVFVSEYPPGTPPHSGNFPKRNRILAALGRAAVVFEASAKSGSMITASLAVNQGRELFCLPPADIFSGAFAGNIELLREGATALYGSLYIMDYFRFGGAADMEIRAELPAVTAAKLRSELHDLVKISENTAEPQEEYIEPQETDEEPALEEKEETENIPEISAYNDELTERQNNIVALLRGGALHADVIAARLGLDAADLMTELTELEIYGEIRSLAGKMYEICE